MAFFKNKIVPRTVDFSLPLPRHIGFIMDGNGRWAKKRAMPREFGHRQGAAVFRKVVEHCIDLGIECVTVYAFSTENWKRPQSEIDGIISLLVDYLKDGLLDNKTKNSRVRFIGDTSVFSPDIQELMREVCRISAKYQTQLNVALNYGGRAEIVNAVNEAIREGKNTICEEDISERTYTHDQPEPDLIVRTGGEYRLSNFLTWQSVYSELYFTDTLWPDMKDSDVDRAVAFYQHRQRRWGGVK